MSAGQSVVAPQPQVVPSQMCPSALLVQSRHSPPAAPHAVEVPPPQVPVLPPRGMLQHDPLHVSLAEHVVVQVWVVVLHEPPASLDAVQSPGTAHPHAPPFVPATHAVPTLSPAQLAHVFPFEPQPLAATSPVVHVPPVPQHPPLQS